MKRVLALVLLGVAIAAWHGASALLEPSVDFNHEVIDDALEDVEEPAWFHEYKPGRDLA